MQDFQSKIGAVVAVYKVARAVAAAQTIIGNSAELLQIRDAIIRYVPLEEQQEILSLLNTLIEGRMPEPAEAQLVVSAIEGLNNDSKRGLQ